MPPLMPPAGGQPPPTGMDGAASAAPPPAEQPPVAPPRHPSTAEGSLDDAQVDDFVHKGMELIYGGKSPDGQLSDPIAGMLRRQANDPTQALAETAAKVASTVISSAMDADVSLDPAAAFAGTMELVGELGSVAATEGIYDYDQDEINTAAVRAGEVLHGLTKDIGFFSQEEAMADAGEIVEASQTGEMDDAIRTIEQGGAAPSAPPSGGGFMKG